MIMERIHIKRQTIQMKRIIPLICVVRYEIHLTFVTHRVTLYHMIKSFKHKGLEDFFYTGSKKEILPNYANRLERILDRLNAATEIKDMNYPGSFERDRAFCAAF